MFNSQSEIRAEYEKRLLARRKHAADWWDAVRRLGTARLLVFVAFVVAAWFVTERHALPGWVLMIPLGLFVWLVFKHRDAYDAWERERRAEAFYDDGMHRIDDDWTGRGTGGERFADAAHPYTSDLDVFGKGSLYELLCLARTKGGEERLASWLRAPAGMRAALDGAGGAESVPAAATSAAAAAQPQPADIVRILNERQAAVAELRPALDLREDVAIVTSERSVIDHEALAKWGARPVTLKSGPVRIAAFILGAISLGTLVYWFITWDFLPLLIMLAISQPFAAIWRGQVMDVIAGIDKPRRDLQMLSSYLDRLQREKYSAPLLARLRATIDGDPAKRLRKLITLMEYAESGRNVFFAPFGVVMLWALQFAFAIEKWRLDVGPDIAAWLDTLAEMEALLSLSGFACEHPDDVFPELTDDCPRFEGRGLGHPLIPLRTVIRNDVTLGRERQLILVSGSNMAGKSSLLRTVGTNAVLGLAGATVRAEALRLSPVAVGACMRVQDSLQQGISHFYAEIKRLRQIVDMAADGRPLPLLFLFDEILHGTNSYDRSIGAEAVVKSLVQRGTVGLVTTHDLALTSIVDHLAPRAENIHFQDELVDGKMSFDYRLRPGVVEKSNAIALMRAVGLEV